MQQEINSLRLASLRDRALATTLVVSIFERIRNFGEETEDPENSSSQVREGTPEPLVPPANTPVSEPEDILDPFQSFERDLDFNIELLSGANMANSVNTEGPEPQENVVRPVKQSWMDLTAEAREVLKGDKHKMRLQVFSKDRPETFEAWLTALEDYFRWNNIENDEAKINIAMTQMDLTTRELLEDVIASARGYDWELFKDELLQEFPEAQDRKIGSRERLLAVCERAKYIPFGHTSKLAAFNREFNLEAKKLKNTMPPLITNIDLVSYYLNTLEPRFADEIRKHLVAKAMSEMRRDTDIREKLKKRQDPWTIDEVQEAAITMSATMVQSVYAPGLGVSSRDTYSGVSPEGLNRLHGVKQTADQYVRPPMPETQDRKIKDEWEHKVFSINGYLQCETSRTWTPSFRAE